MPDDLDVAEYVCWLDTGIIYCTPNQRQETARDHNSCGCAACESSWRLCVCMCTTFLVNEPYLFLLPLYFLPSPSLLSSFSPSNFFLLPSPSPPLDFPPLNFPPDLSFFLPLTFPFPGFSFSLLFPLSLLPSSPSPPFLLLFLSSLRSGLFCGSSHTMRATIPIMSTRVSLG